jgi:hypothetical protein
VQQPAALTGAAAGPSWEPSTQRATVQVGACIGLGHLGVSSVLELCAFMTEKLCRSFICYGCTTYHHGVPWPRCESLCPTHPHPICPQLWPLLLDHRKSSTTCCAASHIDMHVCCVHAPRFRRLEDAAATDKGADSDSRWHTNLGQLSGGQRTLVSMAMLLAVARTGSVCGLLLLDEVDAALDEVNQSRASALLRQLAHDKASACQVLCVTHNASFQESCDGFVRVTKSASGHSVPAEPGGDAQVTNPAAAAGAAAGGRAGGAGQKDQAGGRKGGKQGRAAAAARAQGVLTKAGPSRRAAGGGAKRVRFAE